MNEEATTEQQARAIGWRPKEEFRGNPETFVDAETFLRRGEEVLPIVKAENKRLRDQVGKLSGDLTTLQQSYQETQNAIKELKGANSEIALERAKAKQKELRGEIATARENNDIDTELELTGQLHDVKDAISEAERTPVERREEKDTTQADPAKSAEYTAAFRAWKAKPGNEWTQDLRKFAVGVQIAAEMRGQDEFKSLPPGEFLNEVGKKTLEYFDSLGGTTARSRPASVEGSRGGSGSNGRGRGFSDLPADAQAAARDMEGRLVGEGKSFKTAAEWHKHYATEYFKEE